MTQVPKERRPYRSRLREQQAAQTRSAVTEAARAVFAEHGWAGTGVRAVADAAGVSEATVYAAYGSKAGLALALVDAADASAGVARATDELRAAEGDPVEQLRAFVRFDRRLFEHGGTLVAVLTDGRRDSPELDAAYRDGRARGDSTRRAVFSSWPPRVWRADVDVEHALDVYAALCSYPTFVELRDERGWDAGRIESWWFETLRSTLLED